MRLSRVRVHNYRNIHGLDLELGQVSVVVGENRTGKTNLINAIRLVLDPAMPYAERKLTSDDFWDGLRKGDPTYEPMKALETISITLQFADFQNDGRIAAVLFQGLVTTTPVRAEMTYVWAPDPTKGNKYRDGVYFGSNGSGKRVGPDLREEIFVAFLHALRDVEGDIRSWRKSPLKSLLEGASEALDPQQLEQIRANLESANSTLQSMSPIQQISTDLESELLGSVGRRQSLGATLRSTPPEPLGLVRAMQLYIDGDRARRLSAASLGGQNILYFALLQMGFRAQILQKVVSHTLLLVEEPEAHLHPHMQRAVLENLTPRDGQTSMVVTTHSPHVASAVDARHLIRLKSGLTGSTGFSARSAALSSREWDDMNRYLNATQAEMVFADKVLLVEGYAEEVLLPAFAAILNIDLDKEGISVCAIHGTHFESYLKFCDALGIPWALLTDGDLDAQSVSAGQARVTRFSANNYGGASPASLGMFVGDDTLELDLYATGANGSIVDSVLVELGSSNTGSRVGAWNGKPSKSSLISEVVVAGGKGRFAQRLASELVEVPGYVKASLDYLLASK
ncbi:ATP-dependent nuclease [Cryobacterium levicorallinum]|nr:AAA family ATPase [Cryobacterium levicorallinum]GEP26459.1 ATP-dependent endonuclease [Cryobacterium levicorallinum]SFH43065.1 putative ATP-dependent endonuclease of the OLD family [Cryobacterium levicorallinum]